MTVAAELDLSVELSAPSVSKQALTLRSGELTHIDGKTVIPEMRGHSGDIGRVWRRSVCHSGRGLHWHLVGRRWGCHTP